MRSTIKEIGALLLAATILGFSYTFVVKRGFFVPSNPNTPLKNENVQMLSLSEAKNIFDAKSGLFIDARHSFEYRLGHIIGSINIPLNEFESQKILLSQTPKDHLLVVYCDGAECNSSLELALKLTGIGFSNIKVFFGGWQEWTSQHYPTER